MCCPSRRCCLCFMLLLVILLVGLVFGFDVFSHAFHKISDALHDEDAPQGGGFPGGRRLFFPGGGDPPAF
ncbi:hypothetical protein BHE74_00059871 [Ensete ventricosum]|nr:hypothetical protein GW17_00035825 [Ensete ventricosum]RWW35222.1 hypothetical protein BHE74_00059871 [Ensete ventricosum]RZS03801.1 hypothetical protein BHM03_00034025 [Ensete ventricosum]